MNRTVLILRGCANQECWVIRQRRRERDREIIQCN